MSFESFNAMCMILAPILTHSFSFIDPTLGRLDYESLSDQACLELVIQNLEEFTKKKYQNTSGHYLDVCDWCGVQCDGNSNVIDFAWRESFSGTLSLEFLPKGINAFLMATPEDNNLQRSNGKLNTKILPKNLKQFRLHQYFTGEVDLQSLSPNLEIFSVAHNKLLGSCNLKALPVGLQILNVS